MADTPDPFEFLKQLWNPMGLPMGGMATPTLSIPELEKRIADLRLVENWLNMNLSTLRMSIQALELQKMTLQTLQGTMPGGASTGQAPSANPAMDAWLKMMQSAMAPGEAPAKKE